MSAQSSILSPVPPHASFLFADLRHGVDVQTALAELAALPSAPHLVVGVGPSFLAALGTSIDGVRPMPHLDGAPVPIPSTPDCLFVRVAGDDPGEVLHREREVLALLPSFEVVDRVLGFVHRDSRDLSGYIDGTENPTGEDATVAAFRAGAGPGLDGSAVVAVQRWLHDLDALEQMPRAAQNAMIGRDQDSNEELEDAPESAHVKRTAQEDFEPEAFVVRRSMPWRDERGAGLVFVSFSATLDPFEAQLRRMAGEDDGVVDALFSFTRPVTGATFWCPPVSGSSFDLTALPG
ncbi:MAG: Dyp-type peroxidase [Deltaproteobacteria bacterium]|nr:Dyp-type peroxidase [Deltaproteobacteria bacterium]